MWLLIGVCVVLVIVLLLAVSIRGAVSNLHAEILELKQAKANEIPNYSKELCSIADALSGLKNEVRNIQEENSLDYFDFPKRFDDIDRELTSIYDTSFKSLIWIGHILGECENIKYFQRETFKDVLMALTDIEHFTSYIFDEMEIKDHFSDSSERAAMHHKIKDETADWHNTMADAKEEDYKSVWDEGVLGIPAKEAAK
ncbi:hypothetical protein [Pseudenterobacter timonensis]|uniref:hypothetical protein n=1 Tax=Pseudenterobacter timonensis TaxID=1755099 RepID=UPI00077B7060|nr:hypothetical protein [Pseudenterobacter timonensis]